MDTNWRYLIIIIGLIVLLLLCLICTCNRKKSNHTINYDDELNKDEPIVKDIVERLAKRSRIPFENAENVLVLQYKPFRISVPTYDGCCDLTPRCDNFLKNGGQRVLAIEIYLNSTDFDDGATIFPNLNNFKLKPDIGGGNIIFPLADNINKCHPGSKRASERVTNGVKWTMNIWFREKKVE